MSSSLGRRVTAAAVGGVVLLPLSMMFDVSAASATSARYNFSPCTQTVKKQPPGFLDFNVGYPAYSTYFSGFYYGGGTWHSGSVGAVFVTAASQYVPLVSNVITGTPLFACNPYTNTALLSY